MSAAELLHAEPLHVAFRPVGIAILRGLTTDAQVHDMRASAPAKVALGATDSDNDYK